jgi:conjugative transfer signal peptidase TraF
MKAAQGRRAAFVALGGGGLVALSALLANAAGFRVNVTPSVPLGVWRVHPVQAVKRGDVVTLCVPDSPIAREAKARGYFMDGDCPGSYLPLIKPVAAIAGDEVTLTAAGVAINSQLRPGTEPLDRDTKGRSLAPAFLGSERVPAGMVFVLSDYNRRSFDSRYFGMVPVAGIRSAGKPVWVSAWKPEGD